MILVSALETQCSHCTFVPLPCSMVAMFLVATALTMSQSFAPVIGIRYAVSERWALTIDRSRTRSCISGECREYLWEADSDPLSSEVCGLFKSGHAAVTYSILLTFLTRSTSPIYSLNIYRLKIRLAWRCVPISICMPVTTKRKKTDKVHTIRILRLSQLPAGAELGQP